MFLGIGIGIAAIGGWLLILMVVHLLQALQALPPWAATALWGAVGRGWNGAARPRQAEASPSACGPPENGGDHTGGRAMDHRTGQSQRKSEGPQAAMTEDIERVEARVQETVNGLKSTVHRAMEGFKQ
jgi:hypothetical protein